MHNTFLSFVFVCIFGVALVARGGVIDCPPLPQRPPPQSVQFLRPDDIRVVAALGDSITAAFALHDDFFVDGFLEYRGQSFAIGGDKDAYTLPNILKTINNGQRLSGPSIGNSLPLDAVEIRNHIIRPFDPKVDHLNAAQSMAKIDLLFSQVDCLVEEMHKDSEIDFENDWKMITVLIGANNLCECCWGHYNTTPAGFGEQWSELVEKIYNDIPHVVVNVLALFNTSQVYRLDGDREHCKLVHELLGECDCIFGKNSSDATRQQMDDYARLYNEEVQAVIKKWETRNLETFAIRYQPFLTGLELPDISYLSGLDCFHPSSVAEKKFTTAYWNSILTPESEKKHYPDFDAQPICPGEHTYLQ